MTPADLSAAWRKVGLKPKPGLGLTDEIVPLDNGGVPMVGSTDVGDVSWVVPTVQARGATYAIGTPGHSWQLTAQGMLPAAHKGMVHVAKVMAATAVDLVQAPDVIAKAKADLAARTARGRPPGAAKISPGAAGDRAGGSLKDRRTLADSPDISSPHAVFNGRTVAGANGEATHPQCGAVIPACLLHCWQRDQFRLWPFVMTHRG